MTARSDSVIEANYALAGALAAMEGRLTQLVDSIRGQVVNGVLFAGTVILDASGMYTIDFEVPFGSVAIGNSTAGTITFQNEGQQSSTPTNGVGVFTVGAGKSSTFPVAGRALTVYGPVGGSVQLSVYDRPLGAAALGPVAAAGVNPATASDADTSANITGGGAVVSHNYAYNGATWDRIREAIADAMTAVGLQASGGMLYNGVTWDRIRSANAFGDGQGGTGIAVVGNWAYNGANWDRVRLGVPADALATSAASLHSTGFGMSYNGATWDRVRNAAGVLAGLSNSFDTPVAVGSFVRQSLNAAAAAAPGASLDNVVARRDHSMTVTGNGTGVTCTLELSQDGATWFVCTPVAVAGSGATVVGSAATTNGIYTVNGVAARFCRANLTAITTGAVTANVTSY